MSSARRISKVATCRSSVRAAACTSRASSATLGLLALYMTANWRKEGIISRNSSSRLPTSSVDWAESPVTLPPGRARLVTTPVPRQREHDRDDRGGLFCRSDRSSRRENDIDLESNELGRDLGKAFGAPIGPANLDRDSSALDPAEFAQPLRKGGSPRAPGRGRGGAQDSDDGPLGLLRARCER